MKGSIEHVSQGNVPIIIIIIHYYYKETVIFCFLLFIYNNKYTSTRSITKHLSIIIEPKIDNISVN